MKKLFLLVPLFLTSALVANSAPFAAQSDLVGDLSDATLNGIYHHRIGCRYACERSLWLEGFGSGRERGSRGERSQYHNDLGGLFAGFNYSLSCSNYLNFLVGGSWGEISINDHSRDFHTESVLFGVTFEQFCNKQFFGLALIGGVLTDERRVNGINEEAQGLFITPDMTYSFQFDCACLSPLVTGYLRYAGFFSKDYQQSQASAALYIRDRSIQLFTVGGRIALPFQWDSCCFSFNPYIGAVGRFQFDGNQIDARLLDFNLSLSDGLDDCIGYGLIGFEFSREYGCLKIQGNLEGSYDSDCSWRALGELNINYTF